MGAHGYILFTIFSTFRQNGKPVVCIWGFGFNDPGRPFNASQCLNVVNWFKDQGVYLIGGVPTHWRTQDGDSRGGFLGVYTAFDMLSPWMVGRIANANDSDNFYENVNIPDQKYCNDHGIDYQPCVLPGNSIFKRVIFGSSPQFFESQEQIFLAPKNYHYYKSKITTFETQ